MADVFRIRETFHIAGRGLVYMLTNPKDAIIRVDDLFYDLHGNRFKVKGIEMIRRLILDTDDRDKLPVGIMLEFIDRVGVLGNILVREICDINFIFCNHPLYQRKVDDDYQEEYKSAGLKHSCALFSYEDMQQGKLSLYGEKISGLTIYRGWMMKPEMYRTFYQQLEEAGIILINTPDEYEKYHLLPNWYNEFEGNTPGSIWTESADTEGILLKTRQMQGSFIVKDYVKSRKHEWYDACFIPNIRDIVNTRKIITNFVSRQAENLVGGIVLRKFEDLKQIGFHDQSGMPISEEYRVFIYAGRILKIDDYWTDKHEVKLSNDEYEWIESIVKKVRSNFVTVDLARRDDEKLIIMEFGDGQVSGLQQIIPEDFYRAFGG